MAQYSVTHTCGHQFWHQLYGKSADRQRRIEWLETVPCLDCKRLVETVAAAEATADLPRLEGSPKQIAWATSIRAKVIDEHKVKAALVEANPESPSFDLDTATLARVSEALTTETSCRWWIDHQSWREAAKAIVAAA